MQHSSTILFCDQCGLANNPNATCCVACQYLLTRTVAAHSTIPPVVPITFAPLLGREVTPGLLFTSDSQSATSDIQPGTILAECYQIKEEIGRGGFSIVYRAVELDDQDQQVAIKRIPLSALTPSQIIDATETFNREVSMLMRFTGMRGIPKFYGHLADQENWYLVMEYIEGETLEECLQKMPGGYFDEAKTIGIGIKLAQIFSGLYTEQPPVIFRDVKPANIMLTPGQELFLIDFGIARNFTFGKAKDTTPLGSPGYAPPEQYGRAQTDRRADIYGLGATLQTLITGRDPLELAAGEPSRNPQPPSPELRMLLDEMLLPESRQRPVDMLHVQTRLERLQPSPANSDPNYKELLGWSFSVLFFFTWISETAGWLGVIFLVNLGLSIGMYGKWFEKQQFVGRKEVAFGRAMVVLSWILLALLWVGFGLWQFFSNIRSL